MGSQLLEFQARVNKKYILGREGVISEAHSCHAAHKEKMMG